MGKPLKFLVLGLALAGLLAACSGPAKNAVQMNQANAKTTASTALSDLAVSGALLDGVTGVIPQAAQAMGISVEAASVLDALGVKLPQAISAGCQFKQEPSIPTDADLDFVPLTLTFSGSCNYTDDNDTPADTTDDTAYSISGGVKLEDTNDNLKNSGFKISFLNFVEKASKGGKTLERTFNGSYTLDTQDPALYQVNKGYSAMQKFTDGANTDSRSSDYAVGEKYKPDNATTPKAAGTFTIDETNPGSLINTINGKTYSWKWFANLHFLRSCKARTPEGVRIPFDSGSATYSYTNPDGTVSTLKIEFSACGSYKLTLNGEVL